MLYVQLSHLRGRTDPQVGDRLVRLEPGIGSVNAKTNRGQQVGERGARGIHSDAEQPEVRTAHQSAGHHPERGGADVTGDVEVQGLQTLGGLNRHTHPIDSHVGAHRAQHHLGVVARAY